MPNRLFEGVNKCVGRQLPSWDRRGGCAINKKLRSDRSGADGVVRIAEMFHSAFFRRGSFPTTRPLH
jgi:hypothetical protein